MCSWAFAYISSLGCALKSEHWQNLQSSVSEQLSQRTAAFYFCSIFRHNERFSPEMTIPSSNWSFLNFRDPCSHIGSVFKCLSKGFILTVTKYEPRKPVRFFPCFCDTDTACLGTLPWEHQLHHALSQNCLWLICLISTTQDNPNKYWKDCMRPSHYIKGVPKKNLINTTLLNDQLKSSCYPHLYGN